MKMDDYETELMAMEEQGLIKSTEPSVSERRSLMAAAKQTLQKDKRINIRLSSRDLNSLKRKANRYGIPYQTLITSVLHRYVAGDLKVEQVETPNE